MSKAHLRSKAFTLVELLVVITIIALLIALLLPALSTARYRAQITKCSITLRAMATAMINYTSDHSGYFPMPKGADMITFEPGAGSYNETYWKKAWNLFVNSVSPQYPSTQYPAPLQARQLDIRPTYREYMGGTLDKTMRCPLANSYYSKINMDTAAGSYVLNNYMVYATNNWRQMRYTYAEVGAFDRMDKLWSPRNDPNVKFNVLASDYSFFNPNDFRYFSGHPGPQGAEMDESSPVYNNGATNATNLTSLYYVGILKEASVNYVSADGSVTTMSAGGQSSFDPTQWYRWTTNGFNALIPAKLKR